MKMQGSCHSARTYAYHNGQSRSTSVAPASYLTLGGKHVMQEGGITESPRQVERAFIRAEKA